MKVIGLTGGIATGKSEVSKILLKQAIPVFDTDAAVHELYNNGKAAAQLRDICPQAINGKIVDRRVLSQLIIQNPELLDKIEAIIHPLVRKTETEFLAQAKAANQRIAVVDSPLLIETGHHNDMDYVVLVDASLENQTQRAMARPGMTVDKLKLIFAKQMSAGQKRKQSDFIIENNATLAELETQTNFIFAKLADH